STEAVLLETGTPGHDPGLPGWDVLRLLGGEVAEIVGLTAGEEVTAEAPLFMVGRFLRGSMFQMTLLPGQPETRSRWSVRTAVAKIELLFPEGWPGKARLTWHDEQGNAQQETWENWDPWAALVEAFEESLGHGTPTIDEHIREGEAPAELEA